MKRLDILMNPEKKFRKFWDRNQFLIHLNHQDYPKNIHIASSKNDVILDSFAGSGTTAHAVLEINRQDGGNRKFILVQVDETNKKGESVDIAETITAEKVRRVINGYGDTEGTGGSFDFYEMGQPLFLEDGNLNELVGEEKYGSMFFTPKQNSRLPLQHIKTIIIF